MGLGYAIISASAAHAEQRRIYEAQREAIDAQLAAYRKWPVSKQIRPTRCESCGSRESVLHNLVRICAYCRSEV